MDLTTNEAIVDYQQDIFFNSIDILRMSVKESAIPLAFIEEVKKSIETDAVWVACQRAEVLEKIEVENFLCFGTKAPTDELAAAHLTLFGSFLQLVYSVGFRRMKVMRFKIIVRTAIHNLEVFIKENQNNYES
ncbi:hypothetical protein [Aureispira sp. CCB-QB1]|uniref:hypothetical protein n=1 Tax=Aureispira sp. CCB-QB1 TaxID=1313421 RepID=UPI000697ACDC|nr:hypothetical protein [Aureispira sp. CCB-QB1]